MAARFTILASGSSGNAALLQNDGFGLLIDCGLHPRTLTNRLAEIGATWDAIHAVILTHTHTDHWKDLTLADLRSRKIPLWAHPAQLEYLAAAATSFESLDRAGLSRAYRADHPHTLAPRLVVRPIRVSHDAEPTFAFRIDGHDSQGLEWSIGYASDLGCGSSELVAAFAGVDVLALEFNHDVNLEKRSRRPKMLVDRVLGDLGHLSNDQAAELTSAILADSGESAPSHLVQLHLSKDCNRAEIAAAAGRAALAKRNVKTQVITARQDVAAESISLNRGTNSHSRIAIPVPIRRATRQPILPGFEPEEENSSRHR